MDGRTLHLILGQLGSFFSDETGLPQDDAQKLLETLNQIAASVYNTDDEDETKIHREEAVKSFYSQIIEVCYNLEDAVDNYATKVWSSRYRKASQRFLAASYLFNRPVLQSSFRTTIQSLEKKLEKTIKDLDKKLHEQRVEKDKDGPQTRLDTAAYSSVDKRMVIGRKGDLDTLKKSLFIQGQQGSVRIITIVGIAGVGKTTLARLIFEDKEVADRFHIRVWVPISDEFNVVEILKAIIKHLTGTATLASGLSAVVRQFRKLQLEEGKELLIVMDDVKNADDANWNNLRAHFASLKTKITILVTTRYEKVASIKGSSTHHLKELSTEECWQLLSTTAFSHASAYENKKLEEIGRQIVIKCNGLPLAAKHLGNYLKSRSSETEWLDVLDNEISDLDDFDKGFFPFFGLGNPKNLPPAPVSKQDNTETLPFIDHEVYGREAELEFLRHKLLPSDQHEEGHLHVIPIVGMAGIGKTTLAQSIYNDQTVASHFDSRLWVCVSGDFDVKRILKQITEDLTGTAATSDLMGILIRSLQDQIKGKRLLLVLDDVQNDNAYTKSWGELKGYLSAVAKRTTVLATTRSDNVARMMDAADQVFTLKELPPDDCWKLFSAIAFSGRTEEGIKILKEIGQNIVAKCNGLPVAVKTLGGYMRFKNTREEWKEVLDSDISSLGGSEKDLLQIFESSFNHLQPNLKLCLSYCAVFPKDHLIETDTLIKLWMALGYLGSNTPGQVEVSNEDTGKEKLGLEYLKELQMHSFLQDFKMGVDTCSMTCKINGVVHKFLSAIPMRECVTMKVDHFKGAKVESSVEEPKVESSVEKPKVESPVEKPKVESPVEKPKVESPVEKPRHLSLEVARSLFPDSVTKVEKLRSLLVWSHYAIVTTACLRELFQRLRWVRALCFSCCSITKIPCEIGNLNLLRYLNLSYNRNLKELPKEVCDLYNLQTLNLNGCDSLEKLPQGMGKLTNLRHLEILWTKSLGFLPKGVGELSSLLTLNRFVINRGSGHNKACNLGDLQNLNKLTWYLGIEGLGNVTNVEAGKFFLKSKEGLAGLDLWFSGVQTEEIRREPVHEISTAVGSEVQVEEISPDNLLSALEPPSNLRYLGVYYYGGTKFPDWMASLAKLRELILFGWRKCTKLPCLAELPLLELFEIWEMENVTDIGLHAAKSVNMPFPKLERLCIHDCPKIESLPDYLQNSKKLHELSISGCPNLKQSCRKETGEDWGKISHIPNIKIDGEVVKEDGPSSSKFDRQFTRPRSQNIKD